MGVLTSRTAWARVGWRSLGVIASFVIGSGLISLSGGKAGPAQAGPAQAGPAQATRLVIMQVTSSCFPNTLAPDAGVRISTLASPTATVDAAIETHLLRMREAGVDAVSLVLPVSPDGAPPASAADLPDRWLGAMKKSAPGMKLCVCLQGAGPGAGGAADRMAAGIDALLKPLGDNPLYLRQDGKPVILTWPTGADTAVGSWLAVRQALKQPCFFVGGIVAGPTRAGEAPDFDERAMRAAARGFDGLMVIPEGASLNWMQTFFPRLSIIARAASKPFICGISPGYYRKGDAFQEPQTDYLETAWQIALDGGDAIAAIYSWNDISSDTDCWPSANKGSALLDLHQFYVGWFHTGRQPRPERDLLFLSFPVTNCGRRGTTDGDSPSYPDLSYWACLKKAARLNIDGVGTAELPRGLSAGQVGPVTPRLPSGFQLVRGRADSSGPISEPMIAQPAGEDLRYRWVELSGSLP